MYILAFALNVLNFLIMWSFTCTAVGDTEKVDRKFLLERKGGSCVRCNFEGRISRAKA